MTFSFARQSKACCALRKLCNPGIKPVCAIDQPMTGVFGGLLHRVSPDFRCAQLVVHERLAERDTGRDPVDNGQAKFLA